MQIWGILNLTPDSFYKESRLSNTKDFIERAILFLEQGADVLDIGAESTRPGGNSLSADEEWQRLEIPLKELKKELGIHEFSKRISIDTRFIKTTKQLLDFGVTIINDVSGGSQEMFLLLAKYSAQYVLMHSTSLPVNLTEKINYNDVVEDILNFLKEKTKLAKDCGMLDKNIIWDYGIGFGKNLEENLKLLAASQKFLQEHRLLVGISRKSFLNHLLNIPDPADRLLPGIIVSTYLALQQVDILRTHDVKETVQINSILTALKNYVE